MFAGMTLKPKDYYKSKCNHCLLIVLSECDNRALLPIYLSLFRNKAKLIDVTNLKNLSLFILTFARVPFGLLCDSKIC